MLPTTLKFKVKSLRIIKRMLIIVLVEYQEIPVHKMECLLRMVITILTIINPNRIKAFSLFKIIKKVI